MLNNVGTRSLIQIAQLLLSKPNRFIFKFDLNTSITILALVYYDRIILFFHYLFINGFLNIFDFANKYTYNIVAI